MNAGREGCRGQMMRKKATPERAGLSAQRGRHLVVDLRVDILQEQVHGRVDRVQRALDPRAGGSAKNASANKQKREYQPAMHGDISLIMHAHTRSCLKLPHFNSNDGGGGEEGGGGWCSSVTRHATRWLTSSSQKSCSACLHSPLPSAGFQF